MCQINLALQGWKKKEKDQAFVFNTPLLSCVEIWELKSQGDNAFSK